MQGCKKHLLLWSWEKIKCSVNCIVFKCLSAHVRYFSEKPSFHSLFHRFDVLVWKNTFLKDEIHDRITQLLLKCGQHHLQVLWLLIMIFVPYSSSSLLNLFQFMFLRYFKERFNLSCKKFHNCKRMISS